MIIAVNNNKKDLILKNRFATILHVNVDSKINIIQVKEEIEQIRKKCMNNYSSYIVEYKEIKEGSFYKYFGEAFDVII